nr:phosphoethanolamine transferase CptA [Pseudomonas sp. N040]
MVAAHAVSPRKGVDWAALGWMFLFFWYLSGVTQLLLFATDSIGWRGFRQTLLLSGFWLVPLLLVPGQARRLAGMIGGVLWLCSLPAFGYYLIYGQDFSQSVIFILFESNNAEATEYLGQYLAWWMPLAFVGYGLGAWLLWRKIRPVYLSRRPALIASLLIAAATLGYPARFMLNSADFATGMNQFEERLAAVTPWQLMVGYHQYRQQLGNMQDLLTANAKLPPLQNLTDAHAGQPATLVLVIGESTNRQRMSLYGYPRATTPRLDALREQLAVFDNVVTPRPYTIEALQQVLTFADEEHPDAYLTSPSIINLMKQAGYKTYWITNQQTMTERNTMLTTFSKQADEQVYLNNNREQNARQYDGDVLLPFSKALADPAPRKLIVVHLLGTHMSYKYRYPAEFDHFKDRQGVPAWVTDDQLPTYNSYDNALLYNDFVVSSLIERLSGSKDNGFLLYLSDHGEAVFDSPTDTVLGRSEGRPTAPMYTIPFMLWTSAQWREANRVQFGPELSRPFSSANLIHTWADLAGLQFSELDPSKSLVNAAFRARPLLIGDPYQPKALIDFSLIKPKIAVALEDANRPVLRAN